jgi:hypothetical protein
MEQLKEDFYNTKNKVDEIHSALIGDEYRDGIIQDVNKNTKFRQNAGKAGGVLGVFSMVVGWLASKLF